MYLVPTIHHPAYIHQASQTDVLPIATRQEAASPAYPTVLGSELGLGEVGVDAHHGELGCWGCHGLSWLMIIVPNG